MFLESPRAIAYRLANSLSCKLWIKVRFLEGSMGSYDIQSFTFTSHRAGQQNSFRRSKLLVQGLAMHRATARRFIYL
jgi:hypothetical protein